MFIKLTKNLMINRNRINVFYITCDDHIIILKLYIAGHETMYMMELAYFHNSIIMREPEKLNRILTYVQTRVSHLFAKDSDSGITDIKNLKNKDVNYGSSDLDKDMNRLGFNWSFKMYGEYR